MEGLGQAWGYHRARTGGAPRRPGGWAAPRDTRGARWEREGRGLPWTPGGPEDKGSVQQQQAGLPLRPPGAGDTGGWGQGGESHHVHHMRGDGDRGCRCGRPPGRGLVCQSPGRGAATGAARQEPGCRGAWSCPGEKLKGIPSGWGHSGHAEGGTQAGHRGRGGLGLGSGGLSPGSEGWGTEVGRGCAGEKLPSRGSTEGRG